MRQAIDQSRPFDAIEYGFKKNRSVEESSTLISKSTRVIPSKVVAHLAALDHNGGFFVPIDVRRHHLQTKISSIQSLEKVGKI